MEAVKNDTTNEKNIRNKSKGRRFKEKEPNKIMKFLPNNLLFIFGIILLLYKSFFISNSLELEFSKDVILYTILASMLIMCPIINKKNKFAYIYFTVTYIIVNVIVYADFLYYNYSKNFLSMYQIENFRYAKEIGEGLVSIVNIDDILIFITDNLLIILLSLLLYKNFKKTVYKNSILKAVLISIIILSNIFVVKEKVNNIYEDKIYNKSLIVQNSSIYYYHYEDAKDYLISLFVKEDVDNEKLKSIYEENINEKILETDYTGIAKDNNVIILQLESLNEYIIGKKVNGKEITPNLNKFFGENIYCSEMYNQGLGTTADSEFEMENSMYPLENGYVFQKYYNNKWLDIYTTLRENEYYTSFMHPNNSSFWNRGEVYKKGYKIDEYNDINSFPNIENAGEFYSDEGFFEQAVDKINSYEGKFCTTLVSITTHIPFELTGISDLENKLTLNHNDVTEYENEYFKNYLISCNFVDYAFRKFLNKLEDTGLMENTILVVYGDHGSGLNTIEDITKLYNDNNLEFTEFEYHTIDTHIPFGIKVPGITESKKINEAVSKIDIKPTILDLLGIKDEFSIGSSIFTGKDYSFIKGLGYVTSKNYCINDKYYDKITLQEIDENEDIKKMQHKMEREIYLSDTIIKNDLIRNKSNCQEGCSNWAISR